MSWLQRLSTYITISDFYLIPRCSYLTLNSNSKLVVGGKLCLRFNINNNYPTGTVRNLSQKVCKSRYEQEQKARRSLRLLLGLELNECTLEESENVFDKYSVDAIRKAYFKKAKLYHPDLSGLNSSQTSMFQEVKDAYNYLMDYYKMYSDAKWLQDVEQKISEEEFNVEPKLTPQHRHYLDFEGVGFGTPSQRRKYYDKWKADKAVESVFQFRKDAMLSNSEDTAVVKQEKENKYTRRIKTSNMILRMADDMIKESMANGEFDDLPGKGKPLKSTVDYNPYVDAHTHKLNAILINNGYAPEWMSLETEIKQSYKMLKNKLTEAYDKYYTTSTRLWIAEMNTFIVQVEDLNRKIDKLNMISPSLKFQMAHYDAKIAIKNITAGGSRQRAT